MINSSNNTTPSPRSPTLSPSTPPSSKTDNGELDNLRKSQKELNEKYEQLTTEHTSLQDRLKLQSKSLSDTEAVLNGKELTVKEQTSRISDLEELLATLKQNHHQQIQEKDKFTSALQSELTTLKQAHQAAQENLEKLQQQLQQQQQQQQPQQPQAPAITPRGSVSDPVGGRVVTFHFSDHDKKKQIISSVTQSVKDVLTKQCAQRMMDMNDYNVVDTHGKQISLDMALVDVAGGEIRLVIKKKGKTFNDALSSGLSKIGKHTEQIKTGILSGSGTRNPAPTVPTGTFQGSGSSGSLPATSPRAPTPPPVSTKPKLAPENSPESTSARPQVKRAHSETTLQVDTALKERMEAVAQSSRQKAASRGQRASVNRRPSFNVITLENIPETGMLAQSHSATQSQQHLASPDGGHDGKTGRSRSKAGSRAPKKEQRLSLTVSPQDRALFLQQQMLQQQAFQETEVLQNQARRPSAKKSYSARNIPRPNFLATTNNDSTAVPAINVTSQQQITLASSTPPIPTTKANIPGGSPENPPGVTVGVRVPRPSVSLLAPGTVQNLAGQFHNFKEVRAKRASRMSLKLLAEAHLDAGEKDFDSIPDVEFVRMFKMTRTQFLRLPDWKQDALRQKAGYE